MLQFYKGRRAVDDAITLFAIRQQRGDRRNGSRNITYVVKMPGD